MTRHSNVKLGGYTHKIRGKNRSVTIRADTIEHELDPRKLGKSVAETILEVVRERIDNISEDASPATIRKRRAEGRTSTKLYNDTGKLVRELRLGANGDSFQTESPSRLTGDQGRLLPRLAKLIDLNPRSILRDRRVKEALKRSHEAMVSVKKQRR